MSQMQHTYSPYYYDYYHGHTEDSATGAFLFIIFVFGFLFLMYWCWQDDKRYRRNRRRRMMYNQDYMPQPPFNGYQQLPTSVPVAQAQQIPPPGPPEE